MENNMKIWFFNENVTYLKDSGKDQIYKDIKYLIKGLLCRQKSTN